jgi:hypothetical protein
MSKNTLFRIIGAMTVIMSMLVELLTATPALALDQPKVSVSSLESIEFGSPASYSIITKVHETLSPGDLIDITFPADTNITSITPNIDTDVQIAASTGAVAKAFALTNAASKTTGQILSVAVPAGYPIGISATVQIIVGDIITPGAGTIINPPNMGEYTLTISTKSAAFVPIEAEVTSSPYTISVNLGGPLLGIVSGYNSAGVLLNTGTQINPIINTPGVVTITLLGGTYYEDVLLNQPGIKSISGTGDAVILPWDMEGGVGGTLTISTTPEEGLTIDGITVYGRRGANSITIAPGTNVTMKNCTIHCPGTAGINMAGKYLELSGETFNITGIAVPGLNATAGYTNVSNCIFSKNVGGIAANITGGIVTFTSCTFTGAGGAGIDSKGGTTEFNNCTLTGLIPALNITDQALFTIKNSTIDACGNDDFLVSAINITDTAQFDAFNNTIKNSSYWIANIAGGTNRFIFNDFSVGNIKGFIQPGGTIALQHNWWGQATRAPDGFNDATVDPVTESNLPLGVIPFNDAIALGSASLFAQSTVGVDVNSFNANGVDVPITLVGAANYDTNPVSASTLPSQLTAKRFYDVFVLDAVGETNTINIKFYGTIPTDALAEVWFYSSVAGKWMKCSIQTFNEDGGYVTVSITDITNPALIDLFDTPFVLVEANPIAPAIIAPTIEAVNVPIDTTFTWSVVADATGYEFQISDEPLFSSPKVETTAKNNYTLVDSFKYETKYWWRVRTINTAGVRSEWTESSFTTTSTQDSHSDSAPSITEQPASVIRRYLLWALIAVGAILVIVVMILIFRTRKTS